MPFVVSRYRGGGRGGRLVFRTVEASHVVIDDALELDGHGGLGDGKLSIESDGGALGLDIVLEVRGGVRGAGLAGLDFDLCSLEFQL